MNKNSTKITTVQSSSTTSVTIIPAHADNYIYLLRNDEKNATFAVDPSEAEPVIEFCKKMEWPLYGILATHHHIDHIGGIAKLVATYHCPVYGNSNDQHRIPEITHPLVPSASPSDKVLQDEISLAGLRCFFFETPGHTMGQMNYYFPEIPAVFTGDTLFSLGCGRIFEGNAHDMLSSMQKYRALPPETQVYCGHEYTESNAKFALSLEPKNQFLLDKFEDVKKLRAANVPTIPSTLAQEFALNPFLRWDDAEIRKAVNLENASDVEVFSIIRKMKNHF